MASSQYTAADIEVLEGLEPVRKRPGMYIAGTDTPAGLHQLVFEIVDNSVDEVMNGFADEIVVTLHKDQSSITVSDNGRGVPVDKHPKFKKPALELIFTTLHAGGKFSNKNYQTSGGLHGVGSSVVNALSEEMVVTVRRDGKEYQQSFSRGKVVDKLTILKQSVRGTGTTVFFRPDRKIFPKPDFSSSLIRTSLKTKAYLNPGLKVVFHDEQTGSREEFHYQEGIQEYLLDLLRERKATPIGGETFFIESNNGLHVSLALAWTSETREEFFSYANGIHTPDGGSHELAVKSGIVRALRSYIDVHNLQPKGIKITAEDIREGIVCALSVKIPSGAFQAQFQGQTKSKLNNPEIAPLVESATKSLEQLLNEKPTISQAVINRIILAARARLASRMAVQSVTRKLGISHRLTLPGKLADCSSIRPDETELFIVEGDSAGGSTKQGRNRHYQAVLPIRGKVLNTIASAKVQIADNKELSNIISALGCGSGEHFRPDKLRYGKIIILTDADADGMHIGTLLLAFFFMHLRKLIAQGNLYLGKPPLYGVFTRSADSQKSGEAGEEKKNSVKKVEKKSGQKKKEPSGPYWAYSDDELQDTLKKLKVKPTKVVRYKGLGEMNPGTLWETTLNPESRTILRIRMEDENLVMSYLQDLMGNDPSKRFQFIQDYATQLTLDI